MLLEDDNSHQCFARYHDHMSLVYSAADHEWRFTVCLTGQPYIFIRRYICLKCGVQGGESTEFINNIYSTVVTDSPGKNAIVAYYINAHYN